MNYSAYKSRKVRLARSKEELLKGRGREIRKVSSLTIKRRVVAALARQRGSLLRENVISSTEEQGGVRNVALRALLYWLVVHVRKSRPR